MWLILLVSLSQAREPYDLMLEPVTPNLHVVGPAFLRDWHANTAAIMSSPRGSPLFRNNAAHMDAYWRLAAFDTTLPYISEEQSLTVREQAWLGTSLGLQQTIAALAGENPGVQAIYRSLRTLSSPSIELSKSEQDTSRTIRFNEGYRNRSAAMARFEQGTNRTQGTRIRLGGGLNVVSIPEDNTLEETWNPTLGYISALEADRVGPFNFRVQSTVVRTDADVLSVNWMGSIRAPIHRNAGIVTTINGTEEQITRQSLGLEVRHRAPPLTLIRLSAVQILPRSEEQLVLSVTRQFQWQLPVEVGQPLPGATDSAASPALIALPDRQPHTLTSLLPAMPDTAPIGVSGPVETDRSLRRRSQRCQCLGGVPGNVGVAAFTQLRQQRQRLVVPNETQRPDGVEGDAALRVYPLVLNVLDEERYSLRILEPTERIDGK